MCNILFSENIDDLTFLRQNSSHFIKFASDFDILSKIIASSTQPIRILAHKTLSSKELKSLAENKNCKIFEYSDKNELTGLVSDGEGASSLGILSQDDISASISPTFSLLKGSSLAMQRLRSEILKVSKSNISVLLLGETGTGKTTVARAIHELSERRKMPFKDAVLSNSNENLIEAKLFGVSKGAFTGAIEGKGLFEEASGGTLFLDEIGEISANIQTKLLQVLSEGFVTRVGSNTEIPVDARMIFATNANLEKSIREGFFREDLFYRLNDVTIRIPPLRELLEDIEELCQAFLKREKIKKNISASTISLLKTFPWKGNIRQLEKVLRTAALVYSESDTIEPDDIRI